MITIQKFCKTLAAVYVAVNLFSCNNGANTETSATDTSKADTTKMDTMKPPAAMNEPALAAPFDVVEVNQTVKDYAAWKPKFDSSEAMRTEAGLQAIVLSHVIDKPNNLQVVVLMKDLQKAKDFYAGSKVKEMMQKAGVMGKPDMEYLHVVRYNPDSHEPQWVEVTHKVKDFAAWEKVYDAEGKDKRMAEGMVDVVVARGITDSNMVHLIFDIKDMAKAKAAIASEEKKKTMMSAGVIGMPKIVYYQGIQ